MGAGATRSAEERETENNGFVSVMSCDVVFEPGGSARLERYFNPGGEKSVYDIAFRDVSNTDYE